MSDLIQQAIDEFNTRGLTEALANTQEKNDGTY